MGLDLQHVLSDTRHHGAFVCAICQNLVDLDVLVTTACSHCFCRSCLKQWLERKPTKSLDGSQAQDLPPFLMQQQRRTTTPLCPTCNHNLLYSESSTNNFHNHHPDTMMMGGHSILVQPLKDCQPLAYRVLKTVFVECPLQGVECTWKGDYGDLQSHLLSKTAHSTEDMGTTTAIDEELEATRTSSKDADAMDVDKQRPQSTVRQHQQEQQGDSSMELDSRNHTSDSKADDEAKIKEQQRKKRSLAVSFKEEANSQFESGHHAEAGSLYSKALSILLDNDNNSATSTLKDEDKKLLATLYCNRAATHLSLKEFHRCIDDCQKSLDLDSTYVKAYIRIGRAHVQLGQFTEACTRLEKGFQSTKSALIHRDLQKAKQLLQLATQAEQELSNREYATAKAVYGRALLDAPSAPDLLLGAARADLGLGLTDSALRLTMKVLSNHPQNPEGCHTRGQAMFLMGDDINTGIKLIQEALRLDPDSKSIKASLRRCKEVRTLMEQAKSDIFRRRFEEAGSCLTQAIQTQQQKDSIFPSKCPLFATLHTKRAEAYLRLKKYQLALHDCALVTYAREDYVPAWLIKFQAYHGLNRHQEALEEASELLREESWGANDQRIRKAYETADFLVRKQNRVDYYKLLDVPSVASEIEIKKAYKRRALDLHPDRHAHKSQAEQKEAEKQFQCLGEALEILCNDFTRRLYDEGYDPEEIRNRVEAAQQAAHHHGGGGNGRPGGHHYHRPQYTGERSYY